VTTALGQPASVKVAVFDLQVGYPFITRTFAFSYDGASTFVFDGKRRAWNNGTGVFAYAGFNIAFTGIAAAPFSGTLTVIRKPYRSLIQLDKDIDNFSGVEWYPDLEVYRDASLITQRVAAFVLNTLRRSAE